MFGAYCARITIPLTCLVVPFTIISGFIPRQGKSTDVQEANRLTRRSIVKRVVVAFILTLVTLALWPRPCVSYIFFSEANRIRRSVPKGVLNFLDAEVKATIPRGEVELRELPEEVTDQVFLAIDHERGIDGWGHPYMFVAEDRPDGLWIGIYSTGRDGISNSKGNDPDDQNSWGQDGIAYYLPQIQRRALVQLSVEAGITFAFYLPICLLTFQRPSMTTKTEQGGGGQAATRAEST